MNNLVSEDITLPSGATATVRELTGVEEDLMLNERVVKSGKLPHRLLGNLILKLNGEKPTSEHINNMWSADRFAVLLHARLISFGPEFDTPHECSNTDCKRQFRVTANLETDLEYVPVPDKLNPSDLTYTFDSGSGEIVLRPLKGVDEEYLRQARDKGNLLTELIFRRIVRMEGYEDRNELRQFLENAPMRVRSAIRRALSETEFGHQKGLVVNCPICDEKQEVDLVNSRGFFFPEEAKEQASAL